MNTDEDETVEGGCTCGRVRYRMTAPPMIVHCCHCTWCQRETGSAFVINAMVEADRIEVLSGRLEVIDTPSESGRGQKIHRCPDCKVAVWSNYAGAGDAMNFVRVGTLDHPDRFPPDIHVFTSSKLPWVTLPAEVPAVPEFYRFKEHWSDENIERYKAVKKNLEP